MNFKELIKNPNIWIIGLLTIIVFMGFVYGGFSITTQWGSISRHDSNAILIKYLAKLKVQINNSNDMKNRVLDELSNLYEEKLKNYCKENNIDITPIQILNDVKYYKLVVIAMNSNCETVTIDRYILDNDLYKYTNKDTWENFKKKVSDLYIKDGKEILSNYYDSSKVIMPIQVWVQLAGRDLVMCIEKNTDKLLEDLKIESIIFYTQNK